MVVPPRESSWVLLQGKDERRSGRRTYRRRKSGREIRTTRTRSAGLGPHLAQAAVQEALFGLAGREGRRGAKFSGGVARAAEGALEDRTVNLA
jgi:hypothetical protein